MTRAGWMAVGVILGFSIAAIVHKATEPAASTLSASESLEDDMTASLLAERDREIAALIKELETVRSASAGERAQGVSGYARTPEALRQEKSNPDRNLREWRTFSTARDTERLLAAGFSIERIEWIRRRALELEAEHQKKVIEHRQSGALLDPNMAVAHILDRDLGLRAELGDDEYERYRVALGRPVSIGVASVLPGSNAEIAGLKPGDEVVSYAGTRVFNAGELNALWSQGKAGENVLVDVRRNGNLIQVSIPRGPIGIKPELPLPRAP